MGLAVLQSQARLGLCSGLGVADPDGAAERADSGKAHNVCMSTGRKNFRLDACDGGRHFGSPHRMPLPHAVD